MLPPLDSPFEDDFQLVPLKRKRRVEDAIPEDEKDSMLRELAQRGASGRREITVASRPLVST